MKEETNMAVSVKQVEELNEKIEKLNTSRTQTETRKEILTQNLSKKLKEYKEKYGVDLEGAKFSETFKKIQAEAKKVSSSVQEEYTLKEQVVNAIESGDIAEANRLLGIEEEPEEFEEVLESSEDDVEEENDFEDTFSNEDFGGEEEEEDPNDGFTPISSAVEELPDEDDSEEEGASPVFGGQGISPEDLLEEGEDDLDDDEFSMNDFLGSKL